MKVSEVYVGMIQRLDAMDKPYEPASWKVFDSIGGAARWCRLGCLGKKGVYAQAVVKVTADQAVAVWQGGVIRPAGVWEVIERAILAFLSELLSGIRDEYILPKMTPGEVADKWGKGVSWREKVEEAASWAEREIQGEASSARLLNMTGPDSAPEPIARVCWLPTTMTEVEPAALTEPIPAHVRHTMPPAELPDGIGEVVVGVIDTGCNRAHPLLIASDIVVINCTGYAGHEFDANGHGTAVASQVVGRASSGVRIGGAVGCKVVVAGVLHPVEGWGLDSWIARGIRACVRAGCRVINASIGGDSPMPETEKAIEEARLRGVLIVAAAGNGGAGKGEVSYPARYPLTLAVSAVNDSDHYAAFSQRGGGEDIAARGVNQLLAISGGRVGTMSGTSMAAPHVTSAVARYLAVSDDLSGTETDAARAFDAITASGDPAQQPAGTRPEVAMLLDCSEAVGLIDTPAPVDPPKKPDGGITIDYTPVTAGAFRTLEKVSALLAEAMELRAVITFKPAE